MNKMDEQILVVERDYLFDYDESIFQGVLTDAEQVGYIMTKFHSCFEVRRGDAEENEKWKQPIPYVIIKRGDEVFVYERLKGGNEARLHNQKSIGLGGHMNRVNDAWDYTFEFNVYRELFEEVSIAGSGLPGVEIIGLINDDENEVGRVHIGILGLIELPEGSDVSVREADKIRGDWVRMDHLFEGQIYGNLETWSQFAVRALVG